MLRNVERNGTQFQVNESSHWGFVGSNQWEPSTYNVLSERLSKDKSFLDIGAWEGPFTLFAAKKSRHVYAIEPDPIAHKALMDNIELNKFDNVTVYDLLLGEENNFLVDFHAPGGFGEGITSIFNYKGSVQSVPLFTHTFDDFMKKSGIDIHSINVIKVDIEGAEVLVIPKMVDYLLDMKWKGHILLSEHPFIVDKTLYPEYLRALSRITLGNKYSDISEYEVS